VAGSSSSHEGTQRRGWTSTSSISTVIGLTGRSICSLQLRAIPQRSLMTLQSEWSDETSSVDHQEYERLRAA
jgi:hypothetical protein